MILFYFKIHTTTTIAELSKYLEVSRRTVCRDIEMLRTSGVDILSSVGKTGGYKLSEDFSFDKIIFNECELSSMLLSTKFLKQFSNTEFAKEADALNSKIEKLLNKDSQSASKVSGFLLIDTEPELQQNSINDILRCVENAYDNKLLLYIDYKSPFCNKLSTANQVAPYGLINKSGFWYVVGFCYEHKVYRTFNVSFISNICITKEPFNEDKGFNLDNFWESQRNRK